MAANRTYMEKLKSSKRKSTTYKYGRRRSRSLGGCISTEICKTIDVSLPPAERLKLLIEYSLQNALSVAEREVSANMDPDKFSDCSSECLINIHTTIDQQDLYTLSVSGDESFAIKKSIADNLAEYQKYVSKLEEENRQWDEILLKEKIALEDASKENSTPIPFKGCLDCSKYESMNYFELSKDVSHAVENYNYKIEKMKTLDMKLSKSAEVTNKFTKHLSKEAEENFSKLIEDTPRTLMKRFCRRN